MKKYIKIIADQYRARGRLGLFAWWLVLRLMKTLRIGFECKSCDASRRIDVVIPTISKDFEILTLVIQSLQYVRQKINKVYIVAPKTEFVEKYCADNNLIFIDETSVLGFGKNYIDYRVNGKDRSGWLFQQLLKLSGDQFVEMDDYLVVDSDTVYVNSNCFVRDGRYVFYANEEWHQPYFDSFERLFGYPAPTKWSLTSHMMIFNKGFLGQMKAELEARSQMKWYDAYVSTASPVEQSCVSDYDTYSNWVLHNHSEKAVVKPFYNRNVLRTNRGTLEYLSKLYGAQHSISFHSYLESK